jgi:hypothetical protein
VGVAGNQSNTHAENDMCGNRRQWIGAVVVVAVACVVAPADGQELPPQAVEAIQAYERDVEGIRREAEQRIEQRQKDLAKTLQELRDSLVKEGKFELAIAVHQRMKGTGEGLQPGTPIEVRQDKFGGRDSWRSAHLLRVAEGRYFVRYPGSAEDAGVLVERDQIRIMSPSEETLYEPGEKVEVDYFGPWYPAEVLKVNRGRYLIRYDGYGSNWDEWAPRERVRRPLGIRGPVRPVFPEPVEEPLRDYKNDEF